MNRYAYVIGQDGPKNIKSKTLKYVQNDVNNITKVLGDKPCHYTVIPPPVTATPYEFIQGLDSISADCENNDSLLFYFSGHGELDHGQLYLICNDTDYSKLVSTSIPFSIIKSIFVKSKARTKIIVLDCCHSGASTSPMLTIKGNEPEIVGQLVEASRDSAGVIIAACGRYAATREIPEFESGFLTYCLVEALGKKFHEADRDHDQLLSVHEFIDWCSEQTAEFNNRQKPKNRIEAPILISETSSDVYITAERLSMPLDDELEKRIILAKDRISKKFQVTPLVDYKTLNRLAEPIVHDAPFLTKLTIIDKLIEEADDASIYTAATILHGRPDPRYMERLISYIGNKDFGPVTQWRLLRIVRDTHEEYKFSEEAKGELINHLHAAAIQFQGIPIKKPFVTEMILQVCNKKGIDYRNVFSELQLTTIKEPRSSKKRKTE